MNKNQELPINELIVRLNWFEKKYGNYIEKRGLHNWKNLFRLPNIYEWTILIMLLIGLFMGWAYKHDIKLCSETLLNIDDICAKKNTIYVMTNQTYPTINFSGIIVNEGNKTGDG